jgi:hypothetical protein
MYEVEELVIGMRPSLFLDYHFGLGFVLSQDNYLLALEQL